MPRHPAPLRRIALVAPLAAAILAWPHVAAATVCSQICPGTGACTISNTVNVDPDSVLDCGTRSVTITGSGTLKVTGGEMEIYAGNLTVNGPGGSILGIEDGDGEPAAVTVELSGNLVLAGKIRVNGKNGGGTISVDAAGYITIPESGTDGVEADGTSPGADGGDIALRAGGYITISDPIHAAGASSSVTSGGSIEIVAGGSITINLDGHVSAEGLAGEGGLVSLTSTAGNITLAEHIDVEGRGATGAGGEIELTAFGKVDIQQQLTARGGVNTSGGEAFGGHIRARAGCAGITVGASLLANGGQLGTRSESGTVVLETSGNVTVASGVVLDTRALASVGSGGVIDVSAGQAVVLSSGSLLDSRGGTGAGGTGGSVRVAGCTVQVTGTATIDVTGDSGGAVALNATKAPPAPGTAQPLRILTGAVLKAKGTVVARDGQLLLAPLTRVKGICSNNALACDLDADCTAGCETGECNGANPDTDGLSTQFDLVPIRTGDGMLATCDATCVQ